MKNKLSVDRVSRGGVIRSGVDWGWVVRSGANTVQCVSSHRSLKMMHFCCRVTSSQFTLVIVEVIITG